MVPNIMDMADTRWRATGLFALDLTNCTGLGAVENRLLPRSSADFLALHETETDPVEGNAWKRTLKMLTRSAVHVAVACAERTPDGGFSPGVMALAKRNFGVKDERDAGCGGLASQVGLLLGLCCHQGGLLHCSGIS